MATKILYVVDDAASDINEENGIVSRKELNIYLEDDWEIVKESAAQVNDVDVTEFRLSKESKAVTTTDQHQGPTVSSTSRAAGGLVVRFGEADDRDAGSQLISTLGRIDQSLSAGGSHLGGEVTQSMPGAQIVSGSDVGKAQDCGTTAGYTGKPITDNIFPLNSRPSDLWIRGWHQGVKRREKDGHNMDRIDWGLVEKIALEPYEHTGDVHDPKSPYLKQGEFGQLVLAFQEGHDMAQTAADDDVVSCPYAMLGLKEAWIRGFKAGGGTVEDA